MREQIQIAAKLYECHDCAKKLFGAEYKAKIQWYIDTLNNYSAHYKVETLKAVIAICQTDIVKGNGMALMLFMAAAVEIIEPSKT